MTDTEKKIMETFGSAIPHMTEQEKDRLLAFGEGMALMVSLGRQRPESVQTRPNAAL